MGQEARCTVHWGRKRSEGKARLESTELIFRGDFRLAIPFEEMRSVKAEDGGLEIAFAQGTARFELGSLAAKWADRIKNPKSVIEKLGVKPGMSVTVLEIEDADFLRDLKARIGVVGTTAPREGSDLIFYGVTSTSQLPLLKTLRAAIQPAGAVWVVWRKGQPALKEDHVRAEALRVGLTDVKVVAFSATHSALKLMIPRARS